MTSTPSHLAIVSAQLQALRPAQHAGTGGAAWIIQECDHALPSLLQCWLQTLNNAVLSCTVWDLFAEPYCRQLSAEHCLGQAQGWAAEILSSLQLFPFFNYFSYVKLEQRGFFSKQNK